MLFRSCICSRSFDVAVLSFLAAFMLNEYKVEDPTYCYCVSLQCSFSNRVDGKMQWKLAGSRTSHTPSFETNDSCGHIRGTRGRGKDQDNRRQRHLLPKGRRTGLASSGSMGRRGEASFGRYRGSNHVEYVKRSTSFAGTAPPAGRSDTSFGETGHVVFPEFFSEPV